MANASYHAGFILAQPRNETLLDMEDVPRGGETISFADTEKNLVTLLEPVEGLLADLNVAEVAHVSGLTRLVMDAMMLGVEFGRTEI